MNQQTDKVSIWFQTLLKSINYTKPEHVKFPKPFKYNDVISLYKDESVSILHIILMLYKAGYLLISKHYLYHMEYQASLGQLPDLDFNMMFILDLEKTKEFLTDNNHGKQIQFTFDK